MRLFFVFLFFTSCANMDIIDPPPLPSTSCEDAAQRLIDMSCDTMLIVPGADEIPGTEDDWDWVVFCEAIQMSEIEVIDTDCIVEAENCEAASEC